MKTVDLISRLVIVALLVYIAWPTKVDNSEFESLKQEMRQLNDENRQRDSVNHELLLENNARRELDRQRTNKQRDENIKKLSSPDLTNDELRRLVAEP